MFQKHVLNLLPLNLWTPHLGFFTLQSSSVPILNSSRLCFNTTILLWSKLRYKKIKRQLGRHQQSQFSWTQAQCFTPLGILINLTQRNMKPNGKHTLYNIAKQWEQIFVLSTFVSVCVRGRVVFGLTCKWMIHSV